MVSYKPVTASLRVLEVLSATNRMGDDTTVTKIVEETGLDKATAIRMLQTLMYAGYIFQDSNKLYRPTGKTLSLSSGFDRHKIVSNYLAEPMERLYKNIDWPSDIALRDGDEMLIVSSSRLNGALSFNRRPYHRAPIMGTALGLSYLAFCDEVERQDILSRVVNNPGPWNELIHHSKELNSLLDVIKSRGYATMESNYRYREFQDRVDSLGVPILVKGKAIASLNVVYLRSALEYEQALSTLLPKLKKAAAEMGGLLERSDVV